MKARYQPDRAVGQGTFGTVICAIDREANERVAIKKVLQDPRFKNRELQIMKLVDHPNVVKLKNHFYTPGDTKPEEVYLNVVMEFVPETLHRCCRDYFKAREYVPMVLVKAFMFQLLRSLVYLQLPSVNVCHRDIKPHNLLVDANRGILKICDFGSAKQLNPAEPNVAYICSRYYRAPELIFGNQFYTPTIDVWSVGCIFAEMLTGEPIFKGDNSMNQLIEIIKILGTPTKEQMDWLTKKGQEIRLPQVKQRPWNKVFREHVGADACDLASHLLTYLPQERYTPLEAMCHPFFDDLFLPTTVLHNGRPLPDTCTTFTQPEQDAMTPQQKAKLLQRQPK